MKLQVIDKREILEQEVTTYGDLENPLFLAKDVANWIEHTDLSRMVNLVDEEEKMKQTVFYGGQNRKMWLLTEKGVKQVLSNSRKLKSKEFIKKLENQFIYKKTPKQTEFEAMLKDSINIHLNKSDLDWEYCPFNNKADYLLTYRDALYYETEVYIGRHRVDFYFPKFNLIVEYDEKHHNTQREEDKLRELEIRSITDKEITFIRVREGKEFEGIITIISFLMHYAFVL